MNAASLIARSLLALSLSLGACAGSRSQTDGAPTLVALGPRATDISSSHHAALGPARFRQEILADPIARFELVDRLIRQIVQQTRHIPEDRYVNRVRPALRGTLVNVGLALHDVDYLLGAVDEVRRGRW
jgi:hypothetical protein